MKKMNFRGLLSAICIASILACFTRMDASPVRFDQVLQIVNARPGSADSSTFSRLAVTDDVKFVMLADGDDDKKVKAPAPQDGRVDLVNQVHVLRAQLMQRLLQKKERGGDGL